MTECQPLRPGCPREERVDLAVIGGGPAGAAAAIALAAAGRSVVVLERSPAPVDKVCGEFLSSETLAALVALGLDPAALGASPIRRVLLATGSRAAEAALPFLAAGLSRRTLDGALLARAEAAGAEVRRGVRVVGWEPAGGSVRIAFGDGHALHATRALLATGKSDLQGASRSTRWPGRDGMLGVKTHLRLAPAAAVALAGRVELHLFPGGCAGLQPVEGGMANLCVTLTRSLYARVGGFEGLVAHMVAASPSLEPALADAESLQTPLAIARVPYGYLSGPESTGVPIWRLGDQAAVTPSFTGDGLAIALESGRLAAQTMIAGAPRAVFAAQLHDRAARQMRPALRLQALIDRTWLHGPAVAAARRAPWLLALSARQTRLPAF
jgi:menaquinone-9 beta-reductase